MGEYKLCDECTYNETCTTKESMENREVCSQWACRCKCGGLFYMHTSKLNKNIMFAECNKCKTLRVP